MKRYPVRTRTMGLLSGIGCLALSFLTILLLSQQGASQTQASCESQLCIAQYDFHLNFLIPAHLVSPGWRSEFNLDQSTRYLSIGWGERNFYIASPTEPMPTLTLGIRALLLPNPSVIRVRQLHTLPPNHRCVPVSGAALQEVMQFIHRSFERSPQGQIIPIARNSRLRAQFYAARGTYSLVNNSNSWMIEGLEIAGVDVPEWAISADAIMNHLQSRCRFA